MRLRYGRGGGQPEPRVCAPDGTNARRRHDAANCGETLPGDGYAFRGRFATRCTRIAAGRINVAGGFFWGGGGGPPVAGAPLPPRESKSERSYFGWGVICVGGARAHPMCRPPIFPQTTGDAANMEPRMQRL